MDFYQGINVTYLSRYRMRFVGSNPYLKNIIYTSLGPDFHLYLNSSNPQFFYLEGENKLKVDAIFEDFDEAAELLCDKGGEDASCDVLDMEFPMRDYLVPPMIELVVKELSGVKYQPIDTRNNANDDLAGMRGDK
jgi:hypothetical protein